VRDLYRRLIERVGEPDGSDIDVGALTPGERALYVLITAVDFVAAGGFEQLFYTVPPVAAAAPASAELVTARKFQSIFERANAIAFAEPARKRPQSEFRRMLTAVESNSDAMGLLDDELEALMANSSTRIEALLVRYIERAPQDFIDR
jgi:hypothetical protein